MVMDGKDRELTDWHRQLLGGPKRISIPLENQTALRDFADALRGLANAMDVHSRLNNMTEFDALMVIKLELARTNENIRLACNRHGIKLRRGRPTDKERLGKIPETNGVDQTRGIHHLDNE